jgi:hypothetical protein
VGKCALEKTRRISDMAKGLLSIPELRSKWRKEKSFYEISEIGTGVQIFVKDVLKSPDVFALRVGLKSTRLENRKNEFLEEEKFKGKGTPDVTIFITPEIVIPVEVERYKNIEAGKAQLLRYQADYEKKYGILTDGYTWRFYINNVYTKYTLKTIFDNTEMFLEFWREYTKPEKYYLSFFEKQGQLSLLKETEQLPVDEKRELFFEDITWLIQSFKNKLNIEGYLNGLPDKEKKKTAVEITYAYIIQFILYKTLVDNEFDDFPKEYENIVEAIHRNLGSNNFKDILGVIGGISDKISKNIYRPFSEEQEFITKKLLALLYKPKNELHHVSPWLDIFVFIKKYNFAEVRNEIFGYIYENYLKALYEDQKKGQYFTDPAVVNFMLEEIGYTPETIKGRIGSDENTISLIDPACGSGTFLYSAVDNLIRTIGPDSEQSAKRVEELVNKNIFGLDIAEFPLYLAEMNILMRMLPLIINEKYNNPVEKKIKVFKTRDSIAEFMDTALRNTINDIDIAAQKSKGQNFFAFTEELDLGYSSYVRNESDLKEMKDSLENQPRCPRRRFDFVIANPPYVGYNESSKQGVLIFNLMKKHEVQLNNIYGVNLHSIPSRRKKYAPKPNLYAFFLALGLALLKDNAKLCYIIPQTVLTAGDLDVIRYHLSKFTTIDKIITFSGKMFIGRGLKQDRPVATSSLIFVVRRYQPDKLHYVEIINCKDASMEIEMILQNIRDGKGIGRKKILQGKLFENVTNWNFIKQEKSFLDFSDIYKKTTESISSYYTHTLAQHQFKNRFYFDGGGNIKQELITKTPKGSYEIFDYKNNDYRRLSIMPSKDYYPKNGPVTFPHGSQGIVTFEQKYKIIWRTKDLVQFQFSERDLLLVSNQSLVISSNNKAEILYLLSLLNSRVNRLILERNLLQENEQAFLLAITSIKEYVRVPRITEANEFMKYEIAKRTQDILDLEDVKLHDLVDFSKVMTQKFDGVKVKGNNLVLYRGTRERKLKIKKNKELVEKTINAKYASEKLEFEREAIRLSELKSLPCIDFEKQAQLKDYIDDLVFALYFNEPLSKIGVAKASDIKKACQKNRFYRLVSKGV